VALGGPEVIARWCPNAEGALRHCAPGGTRYPPGDLYCCSFEL